MKLNHGKMSQSLTVWLDAFLQNCEALGYSNNTIQSYSQQINKFISYCETRDDTLNFADFKQMDLTLFFAWLDKNSMSSANKKIIPKFKTKMTYFGTLSSFFSFITKNNDDLVEFDKVFHRFKLKNNEPEKKAAEYFKDEEIEQIIEYLEAKKENFTNIRNLLLVKLMAFGGLRISECLELKGYDLTPSSMEGITEITIQAKGGREQKGFIRTKIIEREFNYIVSKLGHTSLLFLTSSGKRLNRSNAFIILNKIYEKLGFVGRGCHILRHSFAMDMVHRNVHISVIQKNMRHKRIQTTMVYADASTQMQADALPGE